MTWTRAFPPAARRLARRLDELCRSRLGRPWIEADGADYALWEAVKNGPPGRSLWPGAPLVPEECADIGRLASAAGGWWVRWAACGDCAGGRPPAFLGLETWDRFFEATIAHAARSVVAPGGDFRMECSFYPSHSFVLTANLRAFLTEFPGQTFLLLGERRGLTLCEYPEMPEYDLVTLPLAVGARPVDLGDLPEAARQAGEHAVAVLTEDAVLHVDVPPFLLALVAACEVPFAAGYVRGCRHGHSVLYTRRCRREGSFRLMRGFEAFELRPERLAGEFGRLTPPARVLLERLARAEEAVSAL